MQYNLGALVSCLTLYTVLSPLNLLSLYALPLLDFFNNNNNN